MNLSLWTAAIRGYGRLTVADYVTPDQESLVGACGRSIMWPVGRVGQFRRGADLGCPITSSREASLLSFGEFLCLANTNYPFFFGFTDFHIFTG